MREERRYLGLHSREVGSHRSPKFRHCPFLWTHSVLKRGHHVKKRNENRAFQNGPVSAQGQRPSGDVNEPERKEKRMNAVLRRRLEMAARVRDFLRAHRTDGVGDEKALAS